jgi:oxygen-independent coproporphyrinogen-3 oxidase
MVYWNNEPYLGLGAGAVSYVDGWRWTRVRRPETYIERVRLDQDLFESGERVSDAVSWQETLSLMLRCFAGIDLAAVELRYGLPPGVLEWTWRQDFNVEVEQGLVFFEGGRMRLGWDGMRLASGFSVRLMNYGMRIE